MINKKESPVGNWIKRWTSLLSKIKVDTNEENNHPRDKIGNGSTKSTYGIAR